MHCKALQGIYEISNIRVRVFCSSHKVFCNRIQSLKSIFADIWVSYEFKSDLHLTFTWHTNLLALWRSRLLTGGKQLILISLRIWKGSCFLTLVSKQGSAGGDVKNSSPLAQWCGNLRSFKGVEHHWDLHGPYLQLIYPLVLGFTFLIN